ncbi:FHA domain-containing protein [Corallococcus sp. H22C18031201]|uniref:FHA domain-containing protein n=1 Tax=Citreicoccus inhibens TaxID=2849499 RepID=UPI000E738D5B|nr:FHA domain-containing protein [Citreicoccus inhibens]MBU8898211.1 FHA domain-containing protein [Citreicoccus inhibens]RJS26946.1 FHA domain-containing protein [Corallococcus sp. H22C18031201]
MMTVQELRALSRQLTEVFFCRQVGPFVLVQKPPSPVMAQLALRMGAAQTTMAKDIPSLERQQVALWLHFDSLRVVTLPPVRGQDVLSVGRLPDCDLVVDDPSVSKRHAQLCWFGPTVGCTVVDLKSSNGTFVNAKEVPPGGEVHVRDGDLLGFGDATFAFLRAPTFYARMQQRATP